MIRKSVWRAAVVTGLAGAAIVLCMQWAMGVWDAGWAPHADGPSHLVSALLVREYVREGLTAGQSPMEFGLNFYHRFPKVAIGHWPPMFHLALGLWMLVVPLEPAWILGFQALLIGVVAGLTVVLGSLVLGVRKAVLAGFLVTISPAMLGMAQIVMADVMAAVWIVIGLVVFAYYWRRPGWFTAAAYGAIGVCALLTKPSGAILGLIPPLCILVSRRWDLLKERSFWLPSVLVVAIYGPWHWEFVEEMARGWRAPFASKGRFITLPLNNLFQVSRVIGVAGLLAAVYAAWKYRMKGSWAVLAVSLAAAYILFALIVPVKSMRHYVPITPALAVLAVGGVAAASSRFGRRAEQAGLFALIATVLVGESTIAQNYRVRGLVADLLVPKSAAQTWLVTGSAAFEGDVIAESALRRPSGGLTVYRGSKLFTKSTEDSWRPHLKVGSTNEVEELIERCRIEVVIIGKSTPLIIAEAVGRDPARWRLRETGLSPDAGTVFERVGGARPGMGAPLIQAP